MKREFVCRKCADTGPKLKLGVSPLKTDPGFFKRTTLGLTKQPEERNREISINGVKHALSLEHFNCDHCDKEIKPGTEAIAITTWNSERESEPLQWEEEYLVTDPRVINVAARLQGAT